MRFVCKNPCFGEGHECYFTADRLEWWMDHCGMTGEYSGIFEQEGAQKKLCEFV